MQDGIRRAVGLETVDSGRFRGRIDPSWHQGRGAFGGLGAALLLGAMEEAVADPAQTPRSLTVHFCAPCVGGFELATEVVRRGSRVAHAASRLVGGASASSRRSPESDAVMTMATASFCKDRPNGEHYAKAVMPSVAPASECHDFPRGFPGLPTFFEHVDVRFTGEVFPFSGATEPRVAAWVRMRPDLGLDVDASVAAMLLDILPPAVASMFEAPRPLASVDFTVHFFEKLPRVGLSRDERLLVSIASRWAGGGYTEELRDLWTPDGVLLAQCRQWIALL